LTESELNSRLFRLEYRFPMLDVELLEFAFSVPGYLKVKNGVERYMFRQILEGVTTERIRWRRKVDVSHPQLDREQELLELQKQLYSTLDRRQMQRFIEFEKLDSLIKQKQPGITRKLVFLSSIQSALQSGQLRLASDCNGG
ncbi:MAG: asparagine synthase-related protein, partial [Exilibacterium sp.]